VFEILFTCILYLRGLPYSAQQLHLMCSMFQTLVTFPIKILMKVGGINIFIFSVLSSSTEGPSVRWLQRVGITPLSNQYLEVSGLLPYLQIKGLWYL